MFERTSSRLDIAMSNCSKLELHSRITTGWHEPTGANARGKIDRERPSTIAMRRNLLHCEWPVPSDRDLQPAAIRAITSRSPTFKGEEQRAF